MDLRDPAARAALAVDEATLLCAWKHIALVERARPPTWDLAARLAGQGCAGVRVPSARNRAGSNLVLWDWNKGPRRSVRALDPLGDLPRDQSSWPA